MDSILNTMYAKLPNLIIGFHGCSMETYNNILHQHQQLKKSDNTYDWLGNGIYFWKTPFDSVRGVFTEGKEVYPGSGFVEKTHVQLCIINPNCIKGYFAPLAYDDNYNMP